MGPVGIYLDEDTERLSLVQGLRARGFNILTTSEAGRSGMDDRSQLIFAQETGRPIYTFNTGDFAKLHKEFLALGWDHPGIITVPRQRYAVGEQIKRLAALLATIPGDGLVNRMVYL